MQHSAKYLIHARIQTDGVVERSDVVGAVFGQTEGLLGEELDLRTLQDSEKVGRIDVDIESVDGNSVGTFTVASSMDRVETAVLAASFETVDRVGPCRAVCRVTEIEDIRAAKRRNVVDRATQLLQEFEETAVVGDRLVAEVRERVRAAEITEYAGLPAGPNVETSDAIIVVEGRADVRQLLAYGVKNAIAVEGTDVPEAVVDLTAERTTTAFLDGDRGGDLILEELIQVGKVDYVAFAPDGKSVEDLSRETVTSALRRKIPHDQVTEGTTPREAFAPTEGGAVASGEEVPPVTDGARPTPAADTAADAEGPVADDTAEGGDVSTATTAEPDGTAVSADAATDEGAATETDGSPPEAAQSTADTDGESATEAANAAETGGTATAEGTDDPETTVTDAGDEATDERPPQTLAGHVDAVVGAGSGTVRLLDEDLSVSPRPGRGGVRHARR